ncbi:MAG TPA: alpha/beta hydrolase, partial [Mycobacterium sp.]
MSSSASGWEPDVLPGYWRQTIALGPDPDGEGDLVATLVRRGEATDAEHAVLALHGYTDYFFNAELGDYFAARGFAFYAVDLHKCGRSRLPGQTPHFTTNLASYDAELDSALESVVADTAGARVCLYGHSAGGLIVTLWLDRLRRRSLTAARNVAALIL